MNEASIRTTLRMRARAGRETEFQQAWSAAALEIRRVPGNVRQELSRDVDDPQTFVITSDWTDRAAVDSFGRSTARETLTAVLRDLREEASRSTYEVLYTVPGDRGPRVRVDIRTTVNPDEEEAFERAYARTAKRLIGTRGLVREELLKEPDTPTYHIFAEWESETDFINWVDDPSHADQTAALIRWLSVDFDRQVFEIRYRPADHRNSNDMTPQAVPAAAVTVAAASASQHVTVSAGSAADGRPAPASSAATGAQLRTDDPPHGTPPPVPGGSVREFIANPAVAPEPLPGNVAVAGDAPSSGGDTEVLVVGAGPVGLTLAIELARRGIAVRIVDKRAEAATRADKAIGIHCRTMEIWEQQGIVTDAINAGTWLHGQTVFVNGRQTRQVDWAGLDELPYAHLGLPQYETERLLADRLLSAGVHIERDVELVTFDQDDTGVTARLQHHAAGHVEVVRTQYLVGCDGAHSTVRAGIGLTFAGGLSMFPQLFMLGDVDVDWDMPPGHLLRWVRIEDGGEFTGMLVCVPLKGRSRYRIATLAPSELQQTIGSGVVPPGFWQEYTPPTLADMQAAIDDLGPPGTTASNLRWSSIFRIKHGIVDRYRVGRVFVAGDAAHLHPPAGGQGMNTGIQDAWNLGWKLALAVRGRDAHRLLDSYDAERRPAGKAVVDRAVAIAFTDEMDMADEKAQFLLEMQMTMNYAGSPLVGQECGESQEFPSGPEPGHRAPDVRGLRRFGVAHDLRLFDLFRGTHSTLLLYVGLDTSDEQVLALEKLALTVRQATRDLVRPYLLAPAAARLSPLLDLAVIRDPGGFRETYGLGDAPTAAYLVRPDGHVGFRALPASESALHEHLAQVLAP